MMPVTRTAKPKPSPLGEVTVELEDLDTPPKGEAPSRPDVPKAKSTPLRTPLLRTYATVGKGLYQVDPVCGAAVLGSAEACADSLDALAASNPAVRRALESLTKVTPIGMVIAAHAPIVMAIVLHHRPDIVNNSPILRGYVQSSGPDGA